MTKVLVIRFSSLGDILLTAPVVAALKRTYAEVEIHYLVHQHYRVLVDRFDPNPDNILAFDPSVRGRDLPQFGRQLSETGFDLVLDLHDSLRSKIVRRFINSGELRVYRKPRLKRMLLFYLWVNLFPDNFSVVDEYLKHSRLWEPDDHTGPMLSSDSAGADRTLNRFGLAPGYSVCIPGAAWPQKSWLPGRYVELWQAHVRKGKRVVILGGEGDTICDTISQGVDHPLCVNLKGRTTLEDSLDILYRGTLVVGSDTGLVHAAEALGTPAVMILGPTSRETGARSHHPGSRVQEIEIWCRPCSQNGKRKCYRREQFCLTGSSVSHVASSMALLEGDA